MLFEVIGDDIKQCVEDIDADLGGESAKRSTSGSSPLYVPLAATANTERAIEEALPNAAP